MGVVNMLLARLLFFVCSQVVCEHSVVLQSCRACFAKAPHGTCSSVALPTLGGCKMWADLGRPRSQLLRNSMQEAREQAHYKHTKRRLRKEGVTRPAPLDNSVEQPTPLNSHRSRVVPVMLAGWQPLPNKCPIAPAGNMETMPEALHNHAVPQSRNHV